MKTEDLPTEVADAVGDLHEHYKNFARNDRGANGYMFFATNKVTHADVAIKFYCGQPGDCLHGEPRQLTQVNNPNVLSVLDAKEISGEWGYFITPRCNEGDLDDLIKARPDVHSAIDVALGICLGCSAIHALNMLHRDLKPGNVVMSKSQPKIADFGSVRRLEIGADSVVASRHSLLYRPPESFASDRYSMRGDIYQIGVITYQLLGGALPYDGTEYLSARQKVEYNSTKDQAERSLFIDRVVRKKAETGHLLDMRTLPGWVDSASRRAIKKMTHYDEVRRLSTTAAVVAALTAMRNRIANWSWNGDTPKIVLKKGSIELRRENNENIFVAYKDSGKGFRKMGKIKPGSISEIAPEVAASL